MDVLTFFRLSGVLVLLLVGLTGTRTAWSSAYNLPDPFLKEKEAAKKNLCRSTDEYVKTLQYLRKSKDFGFREEASRKIADQVSKGCDGASERFAQILVLLKNIGMSERKSLEMALEFAAAHPDVQKNFLEVFTRAFLAEFFDYEFNKAMKLAFELSKDYKGNPAQARNDFIQLVRFCRDSKTLDLPMSFCSEYAIRVARLTQFYESGIWESFKSLFSELRERKDFSFDVKTALDVAYGILKNGPMAQKNFNEAFDFATKELAFDKKKSIEFALNLSSRSYVGEEPPVLSFPADKPKLQ